jgi:hypothetical protein
MGTTLTGCCQECIQHFTTEYDVKYRCLDSLHRLRKFCLKFAKRFYHEWVLFACLMGLGFELGVEF